MLLFEQKLKNKDNYNVKFHLRVKGFIEDT